ncbi:MAG: adenylosuccinate lyase, partial [Alphaproteobacteria bacterium]|nr:adenylosuccinate lyase [Alphaproteobacteria bacterium]
MIPRYSRAEMAAIWEPENRFRIWLDIEFYALEKQSELGIAPKAAVAALKKAAKNHLADITDAKAIDKIERETRHDVIAFLTNLAKHVGPHSRFIHQGLTSSDVLDTCLSVQLCQASDLILADLDAVLKALKKRAKQHKKTLCVGRSHGIHAEPTSFGLKLAGHYAEFQRAQLRMVAARKEIATCAISGPVGTFASVDPRVEAHVAKRLGLRPEPVSTQVIPRDRHAAYFATLGVIAGSLERLATEIRHLQRTEVGEVEEFFAKGQKGSSAMPHKRNPILSENITGLARIVRAAVTPALENVALWHERDISHSSVERVFAPDATIALDFALARLAGVVENLIVYPKAMRANLESQGGLVYSQRVLLALIQAGISREDAYRYVQESAMQVWQEGGSFEDHLWTHKIISTRLSRAQLSACFDPAPDLNHVDSVFARVFGTTKKKAKPRRK